MTHRFTIDGSDALEQRLAELCLEASSGIQERIPLRSLEAIVLGGGYGRGEGGVLRTEIGDAPYNDMEFYVFLRGPELLNQRRFGHAVHEWGEELSRRAGIEIEFKLLSPAKIERSPVTMFYYDLVSAHRLVSGNDSVLARCGHQRAAHRIPLFEATRLLMNRCSGLLFATEKVQRDKFGPDEADFVGRNFAKAKLAFGDVVLAMHGQYHYSCLERHKRLKKLEPDNSLPSFESLLPLHEQGVEFKLHPRRETRSREEFQHELDSLKKIAREIWLTLESRRLTRAFRDPLEYALDDGNKCPETKPLKNRLINFRRFGRTGLLNPRYPRERLLRTLSILLWHPQRRTEPESLRLLHTSLRTHAGDFPSLVRAYESLWRIYN
jgi:hypothetical protein